MRFHLKKVAPSRQGAASHQGTASHRGTASHQSTTERSVFGRLGAAIRDAKNSSLAAYVLQTRKICACTMVWLVLSSFLCTGIAADTSLTTLRHETRELLRKEAILVAGPQKDAAVTALCDLYVVLRQDPRYDDSEMLQHDAGKVRHRLTSAARLRESRLRRAKVTRPSAIAEAVDQALRSLKNDTETLDYAAEDQDLLRPSEALAGAQAAGGAQDNGWQLVELIQRIVAPEFWDVQGGPGSMHYFAMRRVLVVRATSDVHEQIRDLLIALPR